MKKIIMMLAVAALALGQNVASSAAVIDFEVLAQDNDMVNDAGFLYQEDGFQFENTNVGGFSFSTTGTQSPFFFGSTALTNDNDEGQTVLTLVDGGVFRLESIDLAELAGEGAVGVTFIGTRSNNTVVTQSFVLDGLEGFETFTFGSGFTGLTQVSWLNTADYHSFDNVNASVVPVPAAVWLLGSGLLGLAGLRRRA